VFMKNEGLGLSAVAVLAWILANPFGKIGDWKFKAIAIVAVFVCSAPWLIHRSQLPAIDENYSEQLTTANIVHYWRSPEPKERTPLAQIGRLDESEENLNELRRTILFRYYRQELLDWRSFGLLWVLLALSLPVGGRLFRNEDARWLAMIVLGGTQILLSIFFN